MQPASRNWLILLAIVSVGAIAHLSLPARRLLPTTKILAGFPAHIGPYFTEEEEFADSKATRQVYVPTEVVYRDYASASGAPINLFVAAEPVGWHTSEMCASYQGSVVIKRFLQPVAGVPGLVLNEVAFHPSGAWEPMRVCGYYWRTPNGSVNDGSLNHLKGKLAALEGRMSFRVEMCTDVREVSETAAASERLGDFAAAVDPEVRRLLQEATESGK